LDQLISSLMEQHIVSVGLEDSIGRVEEILDIRKLSCVPVVDAENRCFGVISAPDLVHFHRLRKNPASAKAWEICTHRVIEVAPTLSVREAAELMVAHRIHHLVVVDGEAIIGIVSSLDLVRDCLLRGHCRAG
jgi:CBS domain-containing protein